MITTVDHDTAQITAQCLCKEHTFTATVPPSSLPLRASACHCNSCRRSTGAMYSIDAPWPGDPGVIGASTLKAYDFSPRIKLLFCGTCSSTMFWGPPAATPAGEREYGVFTGALLNEGPKGLVRLVEHIFVEDTVDGGATPWLRAPNGDGMRLPR